MIMPSLFFPVIFGLGLTVWNSSGTWDDGHDRTLYPNEVDQDSGDGNSKTQFTGEGKARISGEGRLVLQGDAPRFRVLEPTFGNVSITVYAMRIAEEEDLSYQGFVIGARSQHYTDDTCGANTYYASVTYDGTARFEKELFHGEGNNAFYPSIRRDGDQVDVFEDGVPRNVWIGLRFTIVTTEDQTASLELDIDKGEGKGFERVLEFEDDGNWPVDADNVQCEGFYPDNKIIQSPGFVFIRNDGLGQAEYKDLEIREVPPQ